VASGVCPGSCNNSYRKARQLYEAAIAEYDPASEQERPEPPDIQPWPGDPVWCRKCQALIKSELAEIDDLAALIAAIPPLPRPADDGAGKVTGTRDQRSPSARMDDLDDLGEWLRSWEAAARDEDDPRPRRGFLAKESTTIAAWLYHHYETLILNEDAALDFGEEIRRWHRDMARRAAAGRMTRHMKKKCPRCSLYTLWLVIGDDYIRCCNEDCGRAMTRGEYDSLADAA
jgi:hypothetical protein